MEIKVGIQHVGREIVLESDESPEDVQERISTALKNNEVLTLTDQKGRTVLIPGSSIGYVEVGTEEVRRVGFGTL